MTATHWLDRARCAGDADAAALLENTTDEARRYCLGCPVLELCLAAALVEEQGASRAMRHGVRGGHSPTERRELERRLPSVRANLRRAVELDAAGQLAPPPFPPPPLRVHVTTCAWCSCRIEQDAATRGPRRRTCSQRCRDALSRARHLEARRAAERERAHRRYHAVAARTLPAMAETG